MSEYVFCPQADGGPLVSLREMRALSRILNEAREMECVRAQGFLARVYSFSIAGFFHDGFVVILGGAR